MYYNLDVHYLLESVSNAIDENGMCKFQNASGVSVKGFLSLLDLYLRSTLVEYEGKIYIQKAGVCIGSCLAPILSEIFLMYVDRAIKAKLEATAPGCQVFRYVDDYLVLHQEQTKPETILKAFTSSPAGLTFKKEDPIETGTSGDRTQDSWALQRELLLLLQAGLPLVFIVAWAYLMEQQLRTACWEGYGSNPYVWLLIGPRLVALLVNFVFLVNIIRILVTRVKSAVSVETTQFRKAIKATVLLFPLLGITHLLFCINPKDEDMGLKEAYMIINAIPTVLAGESTHTGIFVAVLYCFMNSEVQTAVRNAYLRAAIRRNPNKDRSFVRGNFSQTSTVFLSHFNGSTVENSASSRLGTKIVRQLPKRATSGPQRIPRNTAAVAAV
ncbi:hypothetical protein HPB47_026629 [Ixodes persulcatus]|uniref:Uncharacterized protein n=1 Tax=Ixodes persulcatus TaxID=34615 RepID=A0AC60Q061_IXOPE|nr:hypothetical protein HPB47_026629 [Ixodes persulcatus]